MNLSQRQLRMFVATARLLNISRASEALHITQPALTRALREFEAQLGLQLFHRTTRQVSLTAEGERFLPVAQRLLADLDHAASDLREQARGVSGSLTIAVGTAFGATVLPAVVRDFRRAHPAVRLRLVDENSGSITARVARAEADLGIGSPVGDTAALDCHLVLSASIGLLGDARRFPLHRRLRQGNLDDLPLLKEPPDTSIAHVLQAHGSEWVARMDRGVEVSSLALQLALAKAGAGVALLSALGASHPMAAGLRFTPLSPTVRRELFMMRRRDRPLPAAATAFLEALQQGLRTASLHPGVKLAPRGGAHLPSA